MRGDEISQRPDLALLTATRTSIPTLLSGISHLRSYARDLEAQLGNLEDLLASVRDDPSNETDLPPRLLSIQTAARMLDMSPRQLARHISIGDIKTTHIGRRHLVPLAEVDAYVARLLTSHTQA